MLAANMAPTYERFVRLVELFCLRHLDDPASYRKPVERKVKMIFYRGEWIKIPEGYGVVLDGKILKGDMFFNIGKMTFVESSMMSQEVKNYTCIIRRIL